MHVVLKETRQLHTYVHTYILCVLDGCSKDTEESITQRVGMVFMVEVMYTYTRVHTYRKNGNEDRTGQRIKQSNWFMG